MAKKYFQKALSVGLSLALCAGLVAPSLAASFTDLQNVINNNGQYTGSEITREGDTITLNNHVTRENGEQTDIKVNGVTVTLDLNGYTIDGHEKDSGSSIIVVDNGGTLTLQDNSSSGNGTIKGAGHAGVWVDNGTFNMQGGVITDNQSGRGGGVHIQNGGTFNMSGGEITGNTATVGSDAIGGGGGVFVEEGGTFNMTGGSIHDNEALNGGYGDNVLVDSTQKHCDNATKFNMTDGQIGAGGGNGSVGVIGDKAEFTMDGNADVRGSIIADQGAKVTGNGGATSNGQAFDGFTAAIDGQDNVASVSKEVTFTAQNRSVLNVKHAEPTTIETTDPVVEIDEPAVPLAAGPVTRAEFIDYLWRHENAPEGGVCTFTDVAADHDFILALGWGEQNGVAEADGEGNFQPDELVTVAAVREFLGNFARVFGMDVDVYALTTLTGEDDEAVLNCDEVLAEFFDEELAGQAA